MTSCLRRLLPSSLSPILIPVLISEAAERFSYYGSRAVLSLYLLEVLEFSESQVVSLFAFYVAACYLSPLAGGYLSDVYLGKWRTIVGGSALYATGLAVLGATAPLASRWGTLVGLLLVAAGTGGIKPSAGPFGADQLVSGAGSRSFWLYWYSSINVGSILSYVITPIVRATWGFGAAFFLSFGVLLFATAVFCAPSRSYVYVPPSGRSAYATIVHVLTVAVRGHAAGAGGGLAPTGGGGAAVGAPVGGRVLERTPLISRSAGGATADASAAAAAAAVATSSPLASSSAAPPPSSAAPTRLPIAGGQALCCGRIRLERARGLVPDVEIAGTSAFLGLIPLFATLPLFWALYDSVDSLWTLQRLHMDQCTGGVCLATETFGVLNPLLIILFVPLMDRVLLPGMEALAARPGRSWLRPTPLRRMTVGMQLAALSYLLTAMVQARIDAAEDGTVYVIWQLPMYVVMGAAEMLVSATGLEFAYSQAPPSMKGSVMSLFFFTTFIGDSLNGALYAPLSAILSPLQLLLMLSAAMSLAGLIFAAVARRYVPVEPEAWEEASQAPVAEVEEGGAGGG